MKKLIVLLMVFAIIISIMPTEIVYAEGSNNGIKEFLGDIKIGEQIKEVFSKGEEFFKERINKFTDLGKHWADITVGKLVEYGVIDGYSNGTFKPNNTITRAEFSKIIRNSLKLEVVEGNSFNDTSTHWAKNEINTLVEKGIIVREEYGNDYLPNKNISRIEMAKMVVRALGLDSQAKEKAGVKTNFADDSAIPSADKGYIIIASESSIIKGYPNNTFKPNDTATRAEASQMIINMLEALVKEEPKEEPKEDVVKRVNKTLETRKINITLQKGVTSDAKYQDPKTYEELKENIESINESDFSVKKKSDWEFIAIDQFVSNSADYYYSVGIKGAVKMELPKGSKLAIEDFEGKTYSILYNDKLIDNKFHHGFLIKDGEILQQITKTAGCYSLGESHYDYIHKADYISFIQYGMDVATNYDGRILYVFENPFKE